MKCTNCSTEVGVFSAEWQAQRGSATKVCPSCGAEVEAVIDATTYAKWFAAATAFIAAVTFAFTGSALLAVIQGLALGGVVAVLPSLVLRVRAPHNGIRRVLNRSIELPAWIEPPAGLVRVASSAWAVIRYFFLLLFIALGIPSPWSGVLLLVLGVIGLLRTLRSPDASINALGTAKLGAVGMLVVGVGLLVHRYA